MQTDESHHFHCIAYRIAELALPTHVSKGIDLHVVGDCVVFMYSLFILVYTGSLLVISFSH